MYCGLLKVPFIETEPNKLVSNCFLFFKIGKTYCSSWKSYRASFKVSIVHWMMNSESFHLHLLALYVRQVCEGRRAPSGHECDSMASNSTKGNTGTFARHRSHIYFFLYLVSRAMKIWQLIFLLCNTYACKLKSHSRGNKDISSKYQEDIWNPFWCVFLPWSSEIYTSKIL